MKDSVTRASPTKLLQALRMSNFLNALALGAGGVFVFIPVPTSIDPTLILSAIYVIFCKPSLHADAITHSLSH